MHPDSRTSTWRSRAAFTLAELMVTVGIVGITSASALVLGARTFNILKSSNDLTLASQCLQERMEQIRSSGWTTLTSAEIAEPDDDDTIEDELDTEGDLTTEVLDEPTEFPDDIQDTEKSDPGLTPVMEKALTSAADLLDVVETVTVAKYPQPGTPIKIRRNKDGSVQVLSHEAELVYEDMVKVVLELSWKSRATAQTRTVVAQTVITKSSQ